MYVQYVLDKLDYQFKGPLHDSNLDIEWSPAVTGMPFLCLPNHGYTYFIFYIVVFDIRLASLTYSMIIIYTLMYNLTVLSNVGMI